MPYFLVHTLILGVIWIFLYARRQDLRAEMLFASLLFMLFGFTHPLFIPDYYNPPLIHLFFGLFDLESFVWCFFIGGIASVLYEEIFRYTPHDAGSKLRDSTRSKTHKYIVYALLALIAVAMVASHSLGLSVLRVSYLFALPLIIYMLATRHDLVRESLVSGLLMTTLYMLTLFSLEAIYPGYPAEAWTESGTLGVKVLGYPLEEYMFGFLLGVMWSVIYEEVQNMRLVKSRGN